MEYSSYCKRNGEKTPEPKKQIWKEGVINHEELFKNNGRELLWEQSGCFAAYRKWGCTWRSAEKKFLCSVKRISQIFLKETEKKKLNKENNQSKTDN